MSNGKSTFTNFAEAPAAQAETPARGRGLQTNRRRTFRPRFDQAHSVSVPL